MSDESAGEALRALCSLLRPGGRTGDADPIGALVALARSPERDGPLTVRLYSGSFFVDDVLVRLDAWTRAPASELAEQFEWLRVRGLRFDPDVSSGRLRALAEAADHARREALPLSGLDGIAVERSGERTTSAGHRYGALVAALEALGALEYGEDALPLRRALQAIGASMEHAGAYQLLAAAGALERTVATGAAERAIEAMGFAAWTGLTAREAVELGLATSLAALVSEDDPRASMAQLLQISGMGAAAQVAVVAVLDTLAARRGRPAGAAGRLIVLLERYSERVWGGQPPRRALAALLRGEDPKVDTGLARLYVRWKGPWPIGTAVRLSDGSAAVVVGRPQGPPVVIPFGADGQPGERLDLQESGGLKPISAKSSLAPTALTAALTRFFASTPPERWDDRAPMLEWTEGPEKSTPSRRRFEADDSWMAEGALAASYEDTTLPRDTPPEDA